MHIRNQKIISEQELKICIWSWVKICTKINSIFNFRIVKFQYHFWKFLGHLMPVGNRYSYNNHSFIIRDMLHVVICYHMILMFIFHVMSSDQTYGWVGTGAAHLTCDWSTAKQNPLSLVTWSLSPTTQWTAGLPAQVLGAVKKMKVNVTQAGMWESLLALELMLIGIYVGRTR